ncbi:MULTISPECIES: bifunctional riboflavin kinase/FAD synthetase [Nesterenkonia]|uniref:Riboflavin biosynthesis protein n=1 Tax=Nesterenkonia xinjiangensis TaxID=225327 RepID=A0A7Z0KBA6_9MICC|nr:bifunctional riboflavin kinase/FAD synthetase [Nesterenkonia sp. HG001]MDZ5076117.1 bifunctional riboflavin kinase/FAD synthetase [Nesterenkonia sp. HG001]NYJ79100.1 riboflavin kinase/FMN adenylyltransferase [Nesterenkonia xinjiangensis]
MHYWNGLDEVPADLGPTAVTIGNFDGVHLGHQEVLRQLAVAAVEHGCVAVAVSFDPHPALVHRPDSSPEMLTGVQEKINRLATTGIDALLMMRYSLDLAALTPEEFVLRCFVEGLNARVVVVGHDVRFGRDNTGSFETMVELGRQHGFTVVGVDDFGSDRRCSSTWVREALADGDVAAAREVLGRPHAVLGEVVHGAARGRELGFPTANLSQQAEGMIPADGVYAGWLTDGRGRRWPSAISVGSNPTFDGVQRVVESFVIGRPKEKVEDFDLYGQQVRVEFIERLRGMVAFEGIPELIRQMEEDVVRAKQSLGTDDPEHLDAWPIPAVEG